MSALAIGPIPIPRGMSADLRLTLTGCDGASLDIGFADEGAGHYVQVSTLTDKGVALDPGELTALANWAAETCAVLDAGRAKS